MLEISTPDKIFNTFVHGPGMFPELPDVSVPHEGIDGKSTELMPCFSREGIMSALEGSELANIRDQDIYYPPENNKLNHDVEEECAEEAKCIYERIRDVVAEFLKNNGNIVYRPMLPSRGNEKWSKVRDNHTIAVKRILPRVGPQLLDDILVPDIHGLARETVVPVELLDSKNFNGEITIAQDRSEVPTLRDCLFSLPFADRLKVVLDVMKGVAALHEKGIVHRDVKPDNTFVFDGVHGKLFDHHSSAFLSNKTASVFYTPLYSEIGWYSYNLGSVLSPYYGADAYQLTPAVDVFSCGATLLSLGYSEFEFKRFCRFIKEVMRASLPSNSTQTPTKIRGPLYIALHTFLPDQPYPFPLINIIAKMMSYHQSDRPTLAEVIPQTEKIHASLQPDFVV